MERQWKVKERQWKAKERQCRTFRVAAPAPESSVMFSLQHHKQKHQSLAEWQRKRKERQCLSPHLLPLHLCQLLACPVDIAGAAEAWKPARMHVFVGAHMMCMIGCDDTHALSLERDRPRPRRQLLVEPQR